MYSCWEDRLLMFFMWKILLEKKWPLHENIWKDFIVLDFSLLILIVECFYFIIIHRTVTKEERRGGHVWGTCLRDVFEGRVWWTCLRMGMEKVVEMTRWWCMYFEGIALCLWWWGWGRWWSGFVLNVVCVCGIGRWLNTWERERQTEREGERERYRQIESTEKCYIHITSTTLSIIRVTLLRLRTLA